ncbi:molecular chaperone TorD family protein [Dissulfurirhabdus thermomarina]|uniref:Molecular chaperone TorD family protein n=1 Tax=Dissulfurirhabdus thermomarina TaxID=1765737 RepID=A0A6N9TT51_DISTH|nr:molecular chaperone TorD family protein [Dissulfurirhabdus thermomarina]NDY43263.1 molecular chaperone TorD family protein [Dissulfurirhabdus thermomarina]
MFLGRAFQYPDAQVALHGAWTLKKLARDLGLDLPDVPEISLEELQTEYTRLFINSPEGAAAPPYASIYRHRAGFLYQEGHDEALSYYREMGFEPVEGPEPGDHIGFELAFVGLLLEEGRLDLLERFLGGHLLKWYPELAARLLAARPHPFYAALAQVTDACLNRLLEEVVHEEKRVP